MRSRSETQRPSPSTTWSSSGIPSRRPASQQAAGHLDVLGARLGVAAGVIVGADDRGRGRAHRGSEDLAGVHQRGRQRADADQLHAAQGVLAVQQQREEALLLAAPDLVLEQAQHPLGRAHARAQGQPLVAQPATQLEGRGQAARPGAAEAALGDQLGDRRAGERDEVQGPQGPVGAGARASHQLDQRLGLELRGIVERRAALDPRRSVSAPRRLAARRQRAHLPRSAARTIRSLQHGPRTRRRARGHRRNDPIPGRSWQESGETVRKPGPDPFLAVGPGRTRTHSPMSRGLQAKHLGEPPGRKVGSRPRFPGSHENPMTTLAAVVLTVLVSVWLLETVIVLFTLKGTAPQEEPGPTERPA